MCLGKRILSLLMLSRRLVTPHPPIRAALCLVLPVLTSEKTTSHKTFEHIYCCCCYTDILYNVYCTVCSTHTHTRVHVKYYYFHQQVPITRRSVQRLILHVNQPFAKNLLSAMTKYGSTCLPPTNHV